MAEDLDIKITATIDSAQASNNVADLRKNLKALNSLALQTQGVNDKAFKKIAEAIGDTTDRIDDMRDSFVAFKGSAIEKFNATLNLTSEGLQNLDFDKVGMSLKNLGTIISANPLMFLAKIIIGLIENFDKLANMGGVIGDLFTGIGEYVEDAIQSFKDLSDAIGLTGFQAEENAKKIIEANKRIADNTQMRYDAEIEYAKASGKETTEIEIKKQQAILETNKKAIEGMILRMYEGKKVTDEDKKQFDELVKSSKDAYKQINILNLQKNKKISDDNKKAREDLLRDEQRLLDFIRDNNIKQIDDEKQRLLAQFEIDKLAIKNSKATEETKRKATIETAENLQKELLRIEKDRQAKSRAEYLKYLDQLNKDTQLKQEELEDTTFNVKVMRGGVLVPKDRAKQIDEEEKKQAELKKQRDDFIQQEAINTAVMGADALIQIERDKNQRIFDDSIADLDARYFAEDEKLKQKLASENLTESEFQNENLKLQQKKAKEEQALKMNAFMKEKRLQITRLIIDGAVAIGKTFAQFGFPPGIIPAGLMAAQTAIQVAMVKRQKPAFARGGMVNGPGTGKSDSVDAKLSNGESVINANSTSMFGPLLSAINEIGGGKSFKGEVNVPSGTMQLINPTPIIKTYVVDSEMTSAQRKTAKIDRLSSF